MNRLNRTEGPVPSVEFTLSSRYEMHLRTARNLTTLTNRYRSRVHIHRDDLDVDAKDLINLLSLAGSRGRQLRFEVEGEDAQAAAEEIMKYFEHGAGI